MRRVPLWLVFAVLFVVLFALCALVPIPYVAIDWVPGTTPAQMFWGALQIQAPGWAGLSLLAAIVGTALFALVRRLFSRRQN